MNQTLYFFVSMQNLSLGGNIPQTAPFATLPDAQDAYNNLEQTTIWGNEVNWMQILSVETTVVQATDGSPSGAINP